MVQPAVLVVLGRDLTLLVSRAPDQQIKAFQLQLLELRHAISRDAYSQKLIKTLDDSNQRWTELAVKSDFV